MHIHHRVPETPTWTLMINAQGQIVAVLQEKTRARMGMGWVVVARESELLPFHPSRLIQDPSDPGDGA